MMTEISRTLDHRTIGEIEVFDVETSIETVEFDQNHDDNDTEVIADDQPLLIDTNDDQDILILNRLLH